MEDNCEYIEQAVADCRQVVALQVEGWAEGYQHLTVKKKDSLLRNIIQSSCEHSNEPFWLAEQL
jgi:hypothetical protein